MEVPTMLFGPNKMLENGTFQTLGGGNRGPPPEFSWFCWYYEKMTINKVVQNHQVNKFGTTQNIHTTKTEAATDDIKKIVPQIKF